MSVGACSSDPGEPTDIDASVSVDAGNGECTGQPTGTPCGDQTASRCDGPDLCVNGACLPNYTVEGVTCGSPAVDGCSGPDTCDGAGSCDANNYPAGMSCGSPGTTECSGPDTCDGAGVCLTNDVAAGTSCGDQSTTDCDYPDSCNAVGTCQDNLAVAGTSCGDGTATDCTAPDSCDGAGACLDNHAPIDTACGDVGTTDCTMPDTCNGQGTCRDNHLADMIACSDCASGPGYCDTCSAGQCQNIACAENTCTANADCAPMATADTCVDMVDDCLTATCVAGAPSDPIEAGIADGTDLNTWQGNVEETSAGGQRFYCNATFPVSADGVLTSWALWVDNGGNAGEVAQLVVIRCTAGGNGNGPALSGCSRVGLGPVQAVGGNGESSFSLAGSTQADGATPDASGIVVRAGDVLCADSDRYDIGVDCNGSAAGGGCPGPDFHTQYLANLDTVNEPFGLLDTNSDGTLMVMAAGLAPANVGNCSDVSAEPDGTLCASGGGDTCCMGACVVGPSPGVCP